MQSTLPHSAAPPSNTPGYRPVLVVDERERREIRTLLVQSGLRLEIATLAVGDYLISKDIAIERKRGDDLAGSLCDTRFFAQLNNLAKLYPSPVLLIENFEKMFARKIYEASLYGAIVYTCYKLGIRVIPSQDAAHTVQILGSLLELYQTSPAQSPQVIHCETVTLGRAAQLYFLQGLLDVSEKRSALLLDAFDTPWGVIQAIRGSKLEVSSSGRLKGVAGPMAQVKGMGTKFTMKNALLLRYAFEKGAKITPAQLRELIN